MDGLFEAATVVPAATRKRWLSFLNTVALDRYSLPARNGTPHVDCSVREPYGASDFYRSCAYNIMHVDMPWEQQQFSSVGDQMSLFPINYLNRFQQSGASNATTDLDVALTTAAKYLLPYPYRLSSDGTFSRNGGCCVAGGGVPDFLW